MNTTIKKWIGRLVIGFIAGIDVYLVEKINSDFAKKAIRNLLNPLKAIANALADENPRNDEQVNAIVRKYLNQDVPIFASGEIATALEKIEDTDVKTVLTTLANPVVTMLQLLSDDNPDNKEQLKVLVTEFINDPETQNVAVLHIIIPLIDKKIPDGPLKEMVLAIIRDILLGNEQP